MNSEATTLAVKLVARPKRIALLIDPNRTPVRDLDGFILNCHGLWGGRFNAIIPTDGQSIQPEWWKLFEAVDPDYVHSMIPLEDALVHQINRKILPARISEVLPKDRDMGHVPTMAPIDALGIAEIPRFIWSQRGSLFNRKFVYLQQAARSSPHHAFFLRNFGLLTPNLAIKDAFRDVPHLIIEEGAMGPAELIRSLLSQMQGQHFIFPNELCWMYGAPRVLMDYHAFSKGLHIVVGDHALDVAYGWNRAWATKEWQPPAVYWLSRADADNAELLAALKDWIERTFWSGNDRFGKIISYSVEEPILKRVAEALRCGSCWHFEPARFSEEMCPIPVIHPLARFDWQARPPYTEQLMLSDSAALIGFPRPNFVADSEGEGGWMLDVELEYRPERYTWTNRRPRWNLPKRAGIASLFFASRDSRIRRNGSLCAAVGRRESHVELKVPSDEAVFWTMFDRHGSNSDRKHPQPPCKFRTFATSNNGRYLRGVLELFGTLYSAGHLFENPFWRKIMSDMAGRPEDDFDERTKKACRVLAEALNAFPDGVTASHPDLPKLAKEITRKLTLRDAEPQELTWEQIEGGFRNQRSTALKANPENGWWSVCDNFEQGGRYEFEFMLDAGILFQGVHLKCPACGTREWYMVDDLKSQMPCRGCSGKFPLPPCPSWSFRLNGLVRNAIRKHGLVALIQALCCLESQADKFFMFLPPQDIFLHGTKEPFTDLDLFVINSGRFLIGEVKSHAAGFEPDDFKKLQAVAENLLPDGVLIGAPAGEWPDWLHSEIAALSERLAGTGVSVGTLQFRWPW